MTMSIFWVPFFSTQKHLGGLFRVESVAQVTDGLLVHFTSFHIMSPVAHVIQMEMNPPDWYGGFPKIWVPDSRYFQIIHRKFLYCLYWAIYWGSPLWFQTLLRLFQAMRLSNAEIALSICHKKLLIRIHSQSSIHFQSPILVIFMKAFLLCFRFFTQYRNWCIIRQYGFPFQMVSWSNPVVKHRPLGTSWPQRGPRESKGPSGTPRAPAPWFSLRSTEVTFSLFKTSSSIGRVAGRGCFVLQGMMYTFWLFNSFQTI